MYAAATPHTTGSASAELTPSFKRNQQTNAKRVHYGTSTSSTFASLALPTPIYPARAANSRQRNSYKLRTPNSDEKFVDTIQNFNHSIATRNDTMISIMHHVSITTSKSFITPCEQDPDCCAQTPPQPARGPRGWPSGSPFPPTPSLSAEDHAQTRGTTKQQQQQASTTKQCRKPLLTHRG